MRLDAMDSLIDRSRKMEQRHLSKGFTMMELVIVMTIMAILATVAIPIFQKHIQRAREVRLMHDLAVMREAIDKYTIDKEEAPKSLPDLVSSGYLRKVPEDPITKSAETWQTETQSQDEVLPGKTAGIKDVRSGAEGTGSDGKAYSEY
ncbi:MAG TPA: type II secretion system protein [Blastocatellia bacterium]|nr:type II secretion system protein [Blastocatellia bacterium]